MSIVDFLRGEVPQAPRANPAPRLLTSPRIYSPDEREAHGARARTLATNLMRPLRGAEAYALVPTLPPDRHEAWEACIAQGRLPASWAQDPARQFYVRCPACFGAALGAYANCRTCEALQVVPEPTDPLTPATVDAVATLACHTAEVLAAEAIAHAIEQELGWEPGPSRWLCLGKSEMEVNASEQTVTLGGRYPLGVPALAVPANVNWNTVYANTESFWLRVPFGAEVVRRGVGYVALTELRKTLCLQGLHPEVTEGLAVGVHEKLSRLWDSGFGAVLRAPHSASAYTTHPTESRPPQHPFVLLLARREENSARPATVSIRV